MAANLRESKAVLADRARRMKWWHDARFGMFIHWGLYSQLGRSEWVLNREKIPWSQYDKLADTWAPKRNFARQWGRLARKAGMKDMVLTAKHHEGFCLWDTQMTDFNAVKRSPGRDLVAEYVAACRKEGLKVGLYYSLLDWHHPDGLRCARSEGARRRFVDFTHGCVRELMSNYGRIDILWYDAGWPLDTPEALESRKLNRMVRRLQPDIIINNRSHLPEDFGTSEAHIRPAKGGRAWEACMTFNGDWGYAAHRPPEDWLPVRKVLDMLRQVTLGGGNLLLNIGPGPDGSVPPEAVERLTAVGKWLARNGEAVYGKRDLPPGKNLEWTCVGNWTRKGNIAYFWCDRWPGSQITIACLKTKVKEVTLLASGRSVEFREDRERLILTGLPKKNPDRIAGITVLRLKCASTPHQWLGMGPAKTK